MSTRLRVEQANLSGITGGGAPQSHRIGPELDWAASAHSDKQRPCDLTSFKRSHMTHSELQLP